MANSLVQKKYYYKVYNSNLQYIATWSSDVISDPSFRTVINGGSGELTVSLARKYDNFGEGVDVTLGNRVELWCADNNNLSNNAVSNTMWDTAQWNIDYWDSLIRSFIKIYSGTITQYAPVIDDDEESVDVTLMGYITEASSRLLKSAGNTTITYTNQDPGTIMTNLIDLYRADGGVNLNYAGTIQNTGTSVTYTFQDVTIKEAMDKLIELSPANWFYFIDPTGLVYFEQANLTAANHSLTVGKDVLYSQTTKRSENIVNEVSVIGGGSPNLFNIYKRGGSISQYGTHHRKISDGRVTDNATADILAKRVLDMFQSPETRSVIRVLDDNGENTGMGTNIEAFEVGDTIQLKNINYGGTSTTLWDQGIWDTNLWDYPINYTTASVLTIVSISYNPDYIEIEASSRLPEITKDLQTVDRKVDMQIQTNLPSSPTTRSV